MHTKKDPTAKVAFDRDCATREEVASLLDRLAHNVRAGIIVGEDEAIPIPEELTVEVLVKPIGGNSVIAVALGSPRTAHDRHPRVEEELAHPGG